MEVYKPKSKGYPDVSWLVFNCSEQDQKLARAAFVKRYGLEQWEKFKKERISTGIMELFHHAQDEPALFYANFIGRRVDTRALKTQEAKEKALKARITVVLDNLHVKDVKETLSYFGPLADDGYIEDPRTPREYASGDSNKLEITINTDTDKSAQDIRKAIYALAVAIGKRS